MGRVRRGVTEYAGWKADDFDLDLHRPSVDCLWGADHGSRDVGTVRPAGETGSPGRVARGRLVGLCDPDPGRCFLRREFEMVVPAGPLPVAWLHRTSRWRDSCSSR